MFVHIILGFMYYLALVPIIYLYIKLNATDLVIENK